jgi:hypothetical protein
MGVDWNSLAAAQQQVIGRLQRELQDRRTSGEEQALAVAVNTHVATLRQIDASANGRLVE